MGSPGKLSIGLTGLFLVFAVPKLSHSIDSVRVAYPSLSYSILYLIVAQKEHYFKEEGLNVELLSIRGEIAARTALAGEIDFFTNAGSAVGRHHSALNQIGVVARRSHLTKAFLLGP